MQAVLYVDVYRMTRFFNLSNEYIDNGVHFSHFFREVIILWSSFAIIKLFSLNRLYKTGFHAKWLKL